MAAKGWVGPIGRSRILAIDSLYEVVMARIEAEVRLRPVRFAFLVRPDDMAQVSRAIRINTCLWGGRHNPLVPVFDETPEWWDRHGVFSDSPQRIVDGYLDLFEPDFIVEGEPGLAANLDFDPHRVLAPDAVLVREGDASRIGPGLSVFDIYRDLHRRVFQFARRREHHIVVVEPKDPQFADFCAAVFGGFPDEDGLGYFARGFNDAFEPRKVALDGNSLAELYHDGCESAFDIANATLKVEARGRMGIGYDPVVFVMNPVEARDLLDFWNLRALRDAVVAAPLPWLAEMSANFRQFILDSLLEADGASDPLPHRATVMFSRSVDSGRIDDLHREHFRVERDGANLVQDWYPPIWRGASDFVASDRPPRLTAKRVNVECSSSDDGPQLQLEFLQPDFVGEHRGDGSWANVVQIREWGFDNLFATTFPCDHRRPMPPYFHMPSLSRRYLSTTEGIVTFPNVFRSREQWSIPDCTTAILEWFKSKGVRAERSDAGRAATQIVKTLGGLMGVAAVSSEKVVEFLNNMSRRPSRSAHHHEFKNRMQKARGNDRLGFEWLVDHGAVELGLEVKCPHCSSRGWHPLNRLSNQVECTLCLRPFKFPAADIEKSTDWAFRLAGPFVLPNYANGGYATALAIRCLAGMFDVGDRRTTWSAGLDLHFPDEQHLEADFTLWHQATSYSNRSVPVELMFGEAKSFGRESFLDEDVDRMRRLAERFPGAVMVFATMKNELSSDEVVRIATLAEWGRERIAVGKATRAPVIVLTGVELFMGGLLHEGWLAKGGLHAKLSNSGFWRTGDMRRLADLTQQIYLGLPSYGKWSRERIDNPPAAARDAGD
ncbi:MAG TPA: hypothetical protein VIF40_03700 [Methylosinus sp.]|jgi:hypothetical protein|uniref:hypothetical protein n=1 Tax=Methylosinus sp. TaxID=427 RepID=UPI002F941C0F